MEDVFRQRVRTAAAAAWWTLLIGAAFLLVQWFLYLIIMSAKPTWAPALWGPDATWESIRTVWLYSLALAKLCLWPLALVAVWLTLWARKLRNP